MKTATLLKHQNLYRSLARFARKMDIPKDTQGTPVLVNFGLWGCWYVIRLGNDIHTNYGGLCPMHFAHLHGFGDVIGQCDLTVADGTPMEEAWRASYAAAIDDRLAVHAATGGPQ